LPEAREPDRRAGQLLAPAALSDGRQVAVKVRRGVTDLADLSAATACQRQLAEAGYPCPEPLDGPAITDGLVAGAPAWAHYEHGPWPQPHDQIFDFTTNPPAFAWVLAYNARCELSLRPPGGRPARGSWLDALMIHSDAYLNLS
jgi:hypothetical protein